MTTRSWLDDEPPLSASLRQVAALLRAGLGRPVALLVSVAVLLAVVAGGLQFAKRSYAPAYVLRVVEPERNSGGVPPPKRQLADYVRHAVFTSAPLLDVIRRHGLYPGLARKNPRAALDSFREDIEVVAYQNYFIEERAVGTAPRSARLRVSYNGSSPEVAMSVTRELGELIVQHETSERREQALRAAEGAKRDADAARHALVLRRVEIASRRDELRRGGVVPPQRQVELVGLLGSLPALELRQNEAERREASLAFEAAVERRGVGMSFVVVDDASLSSGAEARNARLALAFASLAFGLPLVTLAVGAAAPRKGRP